MSDILIKNMEMPKEDVKVLMIFPDGNVRIWGTDIDHDEWAEAIEVPTPHGRLIEEPKQLSFAGLPYISPTDFIGTAGYFLDQIKSMPTIIEAEET